MITVSAATFVDDVALTVPVTEEVRNAIGRWEAEHLKDLNKHLAPYGLNAYDLIPPEYSRVVTRADLTTTETVSDPRWTIRH